MKIALTGSTGLIGTRLQKEFALQGWESYSISRQELYKGGENLSAKLTGMDAVIHLSGAPILHRWGEKYKKVMTESRVRTTENLARAIASMKQAPNVFISTSAVGIYSEGKVQTETKAEFTEDFLGNLCQNWEMATKAAEGRARLVIFRLGIVLSKRGGALKKMALPFRLGLGGPIGSGRQMTSWIHIDDMAGAFIFALQNEINGIYNLTAPNTVSNREFSKELAGALHRPSWLRIPVFALKILYGEGATVLTSGQHALPEKLLNAGFVFRFPDIRNALDDLLK